jgi:uncharacterized protein (TIGR03084 family)
MQELCDDLAAEHDDLDGLVSGLDDAGWKTPTPAAGWTVKDQIGHLAYFDERARMAVVDPDAFNAELEEAATNIETYADMAVGVGRAKSPVDVLAWWRSGRVRLLDMARGLDPKQRIGWYGPPMSARSFVTARLMETWAHGNDVADALGVARPPTSRLRHVAHLGVATRGFSYAVRGLDAPELPVRVELTAPDGDVWSWGDEGAADRVRGPAEDFCLVVTQRRHLNDTSLVVEGPAAEEWMSVAQAFAGGPTLTQPDRVRSGR